jgi:hypothetical protein
MSETAHLSTTQDQPSKPTKSGKKASAAIQWMPTTQIGAPVEGSRKASKRSTVHIDTKYSEDNLMKTRQRIFKEHLSTVQMLDKLKEEKQKQMEDQSTVPPIDEDFIQLYNKYEQQKVILGEIDEFLDDLQNPSSHKLSASTLEALEQQLQITKKKSYKYKLQRLYSSELNEELLPKESLGNKMSIFEPGELENVLSELGRTVVSNILATQKSLDEQKKKEQLSIGEQFIQEKHKERELRRKAREKKMKQILLEHPLQHLLRLQTRKRITLCQRMCLWTLRMCLRTLKLYLSTQRMILRMCLWTLYNPIRNRQ